MKLRKKILSYTLPLIIVPFLLMAVATYYFVIRANQIQVEEEISQSLSETIVSIGREVDATRKDIKLLSNVPIIADYLHSIADNDGATDNKKQATTILDLFYKQNPYYSQLSLINDKGQELIKFSKLPNAQELLNLKNENYFRRTLIMGSVQTPVYELQADKFVTIFTHSINKDGDFLGMLVLMLNTSVFERSMRPLANRELVTFIFDDRGIILADAFYSKGEKEILKQIDLAEYADLLLKDSSFETTQKEITGAQKSYVLSFFPSESFPSLANYGKQIGSNWFLGVLEPKKTIPVSYRFQTIFFSILILTLIGVLYLTAKVSSYITIPLEQVSQATKRIAQGVLDLQLDVKTGDEVEDLATAVTSMNKEIQDYQRQLVQTAKLATMGEMTSEISHEIQNRISGISLWLQHLDSETEDQDPRQEYLDEMKLGLKGFMEMLANLKQYYKTPVLVLSEINLNELFREAIPYLQTKINAQQTNIKTDYCKDLPSIMADREKLKSVMINMLVNATDAIGENGQIECLTGINTKLDSVFFEIIDNGSGISEMDLSRIFYPFYSTKAGGSGLGLAISSNIILAHQGKIELQSEIGKGTKFKVILPVMK